MAIETYITTFQIKRGDQEALDRINPILEAGEPCIALDTGIFKVGDGKTGWKDLITTNSEVKSGEIVTNPEGQEPGVYLVLTLNNGDKHYIKFSDAQLVGESTDGGGEIFNDYENNKAFTAYSSAFGFDNSAGWKGYPTLETGYTNRGLEQAYIIVEDKDLNEGNRAADVYHHEDIINIDGKLHYHEKLKIDNIETINQFDSGNEFHQILGLEKIEKYIGNTLVIVSSISGGDIPQEYIQLDENTIENWMWLTKKYAGIPIECKVAPVAFGFMNKSYGAGAFSAGRENISLGDYASTFGRENKAGYAAFSAGFNNKAIGFYSFTAGSDNTASGHFSAALGNRTNAIGSNSFAMGQNTFANGQASAAFGVSSITGKNAYAAAAFGAGSKANGSTSIAMGDQSEANGNSSVAMGYKSKANGPQSFAVGYGSEANGHYSFAAGQSTANGIWSFAAGYSTATGSYSASFGQYSQANGSNSLAVGNNTIANADYSCTFGIGTITAQEAIGAVAFGNTTRANKTGSVAMGELSEANGKNSVAIGYKSKVSGSNSVAFGNQSEATGSCAIAVGEKAKALAYLSFAQGNSTASGERSAALGSGNTASGYASFATGDSCTASGSRAVALGRNCNAGFNYSVVTGCHNTATAASQTIMGKYALTEGKTDLLFAIGNGESGARSNAIEVFNDGHAEIKTQGNTDNSVVIKKELDNRIGEIEKIVDNILAIQESLIGGASI